MALVIIPARSGTGFTLESGQRLKIIDVEGGQTGDLLVYRRGSTGERLSNGITFDYEGKVALTTGSVLWSNLSNPMLTIVEDTVGRHDFLYAPCSIGMYRKQYGVTGDHPNCTDNLTQALRKLGLDPGPIPTAFNVFMNTAVAADGTLAISPPTCKLGDSIVLRAEMPLSVAISACPASVCNGGTVRSLGYEVLDA